MIFYIYGAAFTFGMILAEDVDEWWQQFLLAVIWPVTLGMYTYELLEGLKK